MSPGNRKYLNTFRIKKYILTIKCINELGEDIFCLLCVNLFLNNGYSCLRPTLFLILMEIP